MIDIPEEIEPICRRAGWFPERSAALPLDVLTNTPEGHPALEVMQQFYLCKVGYPSIVFNWGLREFWDQDEWEKVLSTKLVCIADYISEGYLWIDSYGRCFLEPYAADFCFVGENFGEAMRVLLLRTRCRPMLLPDQDSAVIYGETYTRDSPELWHY